jgi:hypothetical protein
MTSSSPRPVGIRCARCAGLEGSQHPDRDAQFVYLSGQVGGHLRAGQPVISVDSKKKEVVSQLANKGREYQPKGRPERVDVHDFR